MRQCNTPGPEPSSVYGSLRCEVSLICCPHCKPPSPARWAPVSPSALPTEPLLQPALASTCCNEIKVPHIRHLLGKCHLLYGRVETACSLPPISSLCSPVTLTAANLFAASLWRGKALLTFLPRLPMQLTLTPGTTAQARGGRHLEVLCLLAPVFSFCSWDLAQPGSQPRPARGKGGSPVTPATAAKTANHSSPAGLAADQGPPAEHSLHSRPTKPTGTIQR